MNNLKNLSKKKRQIISGAVIFNYLIIIKNESSTLKNRIGDFFFQEPAEAVEVFAAVAEVTDAAGRI